MPQNRSLFNFLRRMKVRVLQNRLIISGSTSANSTRSRLAKEPIGSTQSKMVDPLNVWNLSSNNFKYCMNTSEGMYSPPRLSIFKNLEVFLANGVLDPSHGWIFTETSVWIKIKCKNHISNEKHFLFSQNRLNFKKIAYQ